MSLGTALPARSLASIALLASSLGVFDEASPAVATARTVPPPGKLHAFATRDGVQLTVWMTRAAYPFRSLAPVHLKAVNVSTQTLWFTTRCSSGYVWATVRTGTGRMVYPPAARLRTFPTPPCPTPSDVNIIRVPPGNGIVSTRLVVLRGRHVEAGITLATVNPTTAHITAAHPLASPALSVPTVPDSGARTTVKFFGSGFRRVAQVSSSSPGSIWFQWEAQCVPQSGLPHYRWHTYWHGLGHSDLRAPCDVRRWIVIAGQRNGPVTVARSPFGAGQS